MDDFADLTLHAMIFRCGWVPRGAAPLTHSFAEPAGNDDGPPGPPPRPGLVWKTETQRWVKPEDAEAEAEPQSRRPLAVPTDPKRLTIDQADQALTDLGYTVVRRAGGDSGHPSDVGTTIVRTPAGEEKELRSMDVKRVIYGDSVLPVAAKLDAASLSHAFTQTGRGKLLGAVKMNGGKVVSWRVKNPDGGADMILTDDEVRQAVVDAGLARSAVKSKGPAKFGEPSTRSEVAIAGPDGQRAADLLATAKRAGTDVLATITEKAVRRLLAMGEHGRAVPVLFDDDELKELQTALIATIATADLLGRSRVRQYVARREKEESGRTVAKFADPPDAHDPFAPFLDPIPFQAPKESVSYFTRLVPTLGIDPHRYGPMLERHAFTLSVATDQTLLDKVKKVIADRVADLSGRATPGMNLGTATADIQDVLDAAGVSTNNPAYAETLWRTNAMDAYNTGQMAELQTPEMQEFWPAWQYCGIRDGRQGKDHEPKFDRYYPVTAAFSDVRGPRVWNCRCSILPLYRTDWADLQAKGSRLESTW